MKGIRRFSFLDFVANRNPVPYLMGLMVLYQEGRVDAYQREPYSDIEVVANSCHFPFKSVKS